MRNRNLSLKEKLKLKYEEKKREKKPRKSFIPNLNHIDKAAQLCYVFGIFGICGWGVLVAIPFLYSDFSVCCKTSVQCFGIFCFFQLMVNWICIRMVKSTYIPFIHGAMPDGIEMGDHISKLDEEKTAGPGTLNGHTVSLEIDGRQPSKKENIVYIATEIPKSASEPPKRKAFPYWSWAPCVRCNRARPPRCHHCPICQICVLKRDHHCFFAGACVGFRNLRHFTVFIFWAVVATSFATVHMLPYFFMEFWPNLSYVDVILPVTLVKAVFGFIRWREVILLTLAYSLIIYNIWSVSFLIELTSWIKDGTTSFEKTLKLKVYDNRNLTNKLRSVFGQYWLLNFLLPLHFIFEPIEDPINWPHIKA